MQDIDRVTAIMADIVRRALFSFEPVVVVKWYLPQITAQSTGRRLVVCLSMCRDGAFK